jgi:hypothetical protein
MRLRNVWSDITVSERTVNPKRQVDLIHHNWSNGTVRKYGYCYKFCIRLVTGLRHLTAEKLDSSNLSHPPDPLEPKASPNFPAHGVSQPYRQQGRGNCRGIIIIIASKLFWTTSSTPLQYHTAHSGALKTMSLCGNHRAIYRTVSITVFTPAGGLQIIYCIEATMTILS